MKKLLLLIILLAVFVFVFVKYNPLGMDLSSINNITKIGKIRTKYSKNKNIIIKPSTAKNYFSNGKEKLKNNDYIGAISDFTKAINKNPSYIEAYKARALAKDYIKDYKGSKKDYEQVFFLESGKKDLLNKEKYNKMLTIVNKGDQFFNDKKYHDAMFEYNIAVSSYPSFSQPYIRRADTNFILKNYKDSLKDYNKALILGVKTISLYQKLADTKYILNLYKDSISDYEQITKIDPNYDYAYYKLAGAYIFLEDFDNALQYIQHYTNISSRKNVTVSDFKIWNSIMDKYTSTESIRNIKLLLKSLRAVNQN